MKTTKQFGISSDNYYAIIIFQHIFVEYLKAVRERNSEDLFWIVTQYFQTTQHFYNKNADKIMAKIDQAGKLISVQKPTTHKNIAEYKKRNSQANNLLNECWREISNELHKYGFFKRVYTNEESDIPIPTGRSR